jgi:amino acid transporter
MAGTSAPSGGAAQSLYTRQATGLVREISPFSSVALNVSFVSIPLAILIATQAPFAFPGADPFWVTVFCGVLCIFPVLLYGLFVAVMPRSGGDYVFVSRTLNPWVGFAANFNITAWYTLFISYAAYLLASFGFSSAFETIGVATHNSTLVSWSATVATQNWGFGIGAVALIITAALMLLPLHSMLRVFNVLFVLSLVGVVIAFVLMLIHGRSDFIGDVARFGGNYTKILADAHKAGYAGSAHFDFGNTVLAMPLAFASFGYAIVTAYAGGEMRSPRRMALRTMLIALAVSVIMVAILMAQASRTFGNDFLGSATYLSDNGSKAYPFAAPSFFYFFVSMLTKNSLLIALIGISFVAANFVPFLATFLIATRNMFAWSFDRILPDRVSDVNETTHSPVIAVIIVLVVSPIYLAFIVYGGGTFLQIFYTAGLAELLTFMVVAITGIVFPFRRKGMYEGSPIRSSILGIPTLSVVAVISLAVYILFFVPLLTNNALGANAPKGIGATIVIAAVSILLYPISYYINRSRGVDLGLAFRELPPE